MAKRYFLKDAEGNIVFTQIVKDSPSAEEIQGIIGTSEYKLIDTSVMDAIDPEFLGSVDTDFSKLDEWDEWKILTSVFKYILGNWILSIKFCTFSSS